MRAVRDRRADGADRARIGRLGLLGLGRLVVHGDGARGFAGLACLAGGHGPEREGTVGHARRVPLHAERSLRGRADQAAIAEEIDLGNTVRCRGGGTYGRAADNSGILARHGEVHRRSRDGIRHGNRRAPGTGAARIAGRRFDAVRAFGWQGQAAGEAAIGWHGHRAAHGLAAQIQLHLRARHGRAGDGQLRRGHLCVVDGLRNDRGRWCAETERERYVQHGRNAVRVGGGDAEPMRAIGQLCKVDELAVVEGAGVATAALEDLQAVDGGLDVGNADGALRGHGQFARRGDGRIGRERRACKGGGEGRTLTTLFLHLHGARCRVAQAYAIGGPGLQGVVAVAHGSQRPGGLERCFGQQGQALAIHQDFHLLHAFRIGHVDGDGRVLLQHGTSGWLGELHQRTFRCVGNGLCQRELVDTALCRAELHMDHLVPRPHGQRVACQHGMAGHALPCSTVELIAFLQAELRGLRAVKAQLHGTHARGIALRGNDGAGQYGLGRQVGAIVHARADRIALPCRIAHGISRTTGVAPPVALGLDDAGRAGVAYAELAVARDI
ncbi:hypothetical protein DETS111669_23555 [Delftia tsuruhatensis]